MPSGVYTRCIRCKRKKARYRFSCNSCLTGQEQDVRREDMRRGWNEVMKEASDLAVNIFFQASPLWERLRGS